MTRNIASVGFGNAVHRNLVDAVFLLALCATAVGGRPLASNAADTANADSLALLQMRAEVHSLVHPRRKIETKSKSVRLDRGEASLTWRNVSSQRGIILRYMPKHNVAICACAKCGSTALYGWLFEAERRHRFRDDPQYLDGANVQDVESKPWGGAFVVARDRARQKELMGRAFTYALIRDPKERLISAWKSKLACGRDFGTDLGTRVRFVRGLLKTWGRKDDSTLAAPQEACMTLDRFVHILWDIHRDGNASRLDGHFMPQHMGCFAHAAPYRWTQVADIASANPFNVLAGHLGLAGLPEHRHGSHSSVFVSKDVNAILTKITRQEYAVLQSYLSRPSLVKPGAYALASADVRN